MAVVEDLIEGQTAPIKTRLLANGEGLDITGLADPEIVACRLDGTTITLAGTITVVEAGTGKIQFDPNAADLLEVNSPMKVRYKVTDGAGDIAYFPGNEEADTWNVVKHC